MFSTLHMLNAAHVTDSNEMIINIVLNKILNCNIETISIYDWPKPQRRKNNATKNAHFFFLLWKKECFQIKFAEIVTSSCEIFIQIPKAFNEISRTLISG